MRAVTEAPAEPVIYTLSADGDDRTEQTEPNDAPETEPVPGNENAVPDTPVSDPDPEPIPASIPASIPAADGQPENEPDAALVYVLNTNTKKIHLPDCKSVADMKESNKALCKDPEEALAEGYAWCKRCHG